MKPSAALIRPYFWRFYPRRLSLFWRSLLLLTLFSSFCLAQESDIEVARRKFGQALELEVAKDWSSALKLYREVSLVKMTPQVRYHIATCEENLGHLVAALGGYYLAEQQSAGMHPDFVNEVVASIDDLKSRIPKFVLERGLGAEGATIQLDGIQLGEAQLGAELPLDPGPHQLTAEAPGYDSLQVTLVARESELERFEITLEKTPIETFAASSEPGVEEEQGYGKLPYIIGGSGLGVAVVGGIFLGLSQGKVGKINDTCGGEKSCETAIDGDPEVFDELSRLQKQANTLEAVGWVGLGLGVSAIAAGTILYFIDPLRTSETARLKFNAYAPASDVGFSLTTHF